MSNTIMWYCSLSVSHVIPEGFFNSSCFSEYCLFSVVSFTVICLGKISVHPDLFGDFIC